MKKSTRLILGFIAAVLFSFAFVIVLRLLEGASVFDVSTVIFSVSNLLIIIGVIGVFFRIQKENATKPVAVLKKRLMPSFLVFTLLTILISLVLFGLGVYLVFIVKGWNTDGFLNHLFTVEFRGAFISLSAGIFLCSIVFYHTTWRQAADREQQLQKENLKYKYKTLKAQVNPHFLFNNLNTLSEIIYTDTEKADIYIQKLANIYRYILENEETDLISLGEEMDFVRRYFDLQKERDGYKIQLEIDFPNPDRYRVVPISLQILLENALKHNSASEMYPLRINVYAGNEKYVVVSNNIQKKSVLKGSHGTGLSNLKERVKLITGKELLVETKNNRFTVKLPIVSI